MSRAKKRAPRTIPGVNEATRLRFALAEEIGASYASNHNAQVVVVAGSVGRGSADRYSDIDVDVYYAEPPTEAERIGAVERCGGTVHQLAQDADEWEEQMSIGDFHAHTSTFLVATIERYPREVVDDCSLAPEAQTRLFSLLHGIPLKGEGWNPSGRAVTRTWPLSRVTPASPVRDLRSPGNGIVGDRVEEVCAPILLGAGRVNSVERAVHCRHGH